MPNAARDDVIPRVLSRYIALFYSITVMFTQFPWQIRPAKRILLHYEISIIQDSKERNFAVILPPRAIPSRLHPRPISSLYEVRSCI
jgi:hypothetical protein